MRKIPILVTLGVVLTILLSSTGMVNAQYFCTATAAIPPMVRGEGLAELVADLVLVCSGTLQSAASVNIQIFLNTYVTSKVLDGAGTTEALLMLDDPPPGSQVLNTNIFLGTKMSQENSITWIGIPLNPPGPRVFRFKNIRVNANQVFNPGSPLPGQIMELISVTGTQLIPIINPTQVMAFVQKGMNPSVSDLSGKPSQFSITFSEGFTGAFKKDIQGSYQNLPGSIYNTESGFTSSVTGIVGNADSGTRLVARFEGIPSGVTLSVPVTVNGNHALQAVLYGGVSPDYSGGIPTISGLVNITGGFGYAVWEVIDADPANIEQVTIPVTVSYAPGVPGLDGMIVGGNYGPLSTTWTGTLTGPVPRFIKTPLNDVAEFVRQQYRDFLNREADAGGLQYWVNLINSGTMTREVVVESFFWSEEFAVRIAPIVRLYFAYFLRIPDYSGLQYWINTYNSGMSLEAISNSFASSPEFLAQYGSLTNEQFVILVYQNVLGRAPDTGGYAYWVGQLNSGAKTRGQVMIGLSESPEYIAASSHEVFVTMMYVGMLRRSPDQAGFDFWVNYLDTGNSELALINGILYSQEYADRF